MPAKWTQEQEKALDRIRADHSKGAAKREQARAKEAEKTAKAKGKKLTDMLAQFVKRYKEPVVTTIANGQRAADVKAVPTLFPELDDLLTGETDASARTIAGTGVGMPLGRIIEIYGGEGVGKTTLTLLMIKAMQAAGKVCSFVDAEHALDVKYAARLGVKMDELLVSQPDAGGEQALDIVQTLAASGAVDCIVVDSVAALTPLKELEGDMGDAHVAAQARLMSQACRKLTGIVAKRDVLLIFINQERMKIGVMFGNPRTTTGGNALRYYASIRLEMTVVKTLKKGDHIIGKRVRVKTVKNKTAPPFREIYCDIMPNMGIAAIHGDYDGGGEE